MRFLTGFPGFLGSALVGKLLDRTDDRVVCLVQSAYRDVAEERADAIAVDRGDVRGSGPDADRDAVRDRIELVTGDIRDPALGLENPEEIQADATEVYHLAAVYDLGVEREFGMRVNVDGTGRVLDFAEAVSDLDRLHYVSTCYVSGRHDGVFTADDLDVGQSFNNHYEETKFLAETAVRERMGGDLPTTIYRPSIAVGDSETGATTKYDGPYYLLALLRRQPRIAFVPGPIHADAYEFNVVPRDYVVDAIDRLAARADTVDRTFQLCDPAPPTVGDLIDAFASALGRRAVRVPVQRHLLRAAMERVPSLANRSGVEPASVDYLWHPTIYRNDSTRDVLGDLADPPRFPDYVDALVEYALAHPEIESDAMV